MPPTVGEGLLQLKATAVSVKLSVKLKTGSTKHTHFLFVFQNYQNLNGHLPMFKTLTLTSTYFVRRS